MSKTVIYIKRKSQLKYKSIESLFSSIINEVSKSYKTELVYTKYAGGSPTTIVKNVFTFKNIEKSIVHITGDVHYMALVTRKKSVLTIHDVGSALNGSFVKQLYTKLFWFWLPALCVDYITVISEFTKRELSQIIPFVRHKIKVIPNPVNKAFCAMPYLFNSDQPTILCVGTKPNKNLERVIEAVAAISCRLHIIGVLSKAQLALLERYKVCYNNSVNLSQEAVVQAYQACDMVCFPSTYEGFGMPIIEGQAVGRPVITSNFGAMLEVAADSTGLIDPFDVASIRDEIKRVISDAAYRENLVQKGFKNIERFQLETVAKEYITIYKTLMVA
jgi:glycosyltransferase involved in cell wall biosynthesis